MSDERTLAQSEEDSHSVLAASAAVPAIEGYRLQVRLGTGTFGEVPSRYAPARAWLSRFSTIG